ncbi:MAG TPA: branched-chain amino acid ABC transporter permease [Streptosporangiaceae bacterium]|nr:branched-chain amino acid ABC transporter permease [Streptosporangiaceae bacterium]
MSGDPGGQLTAGRWRAGSMLATPNSRGWAVAAVLLLIAVIFPQVVTNQVVTQIAVDTMLFVAAAVAWNLFSGFSGYISLGHAVFFGTGAYTVGIAAEKWHITGNMEFALLPLAALAAGVVAVPFGLIALRVRRHTFVVVTIAVFFIFQLMAFNLKITGGSVGISAPFLTWAPETFNIPFYYMGLVLAAGVALLSWLIRGSRFGLQLRAIRDDEDRARGLGVRAMRVKLAAFVISGVVTGLVGAVWLFFIGQVLPQYGFDPIFDLSVALMAFFGGFGTLWGPILGALLLEPVEQYLTLQVSNSYASELVWGTLFLLVILFLSRGVIPIAGEKATARRARRERRRAGQPAAAPPTAGSAGTALPGSAEAGAPSGRSTR